VCVALQPDGQSARVGADESRSPGTSAGAGGDSHEVSVDVDWKAAPRLGMKVSSSPQSSGESLER